MKQRALLLAFATLLAVGCGGGSSPTDSTSSGSVTAIPDGFWGAAHVSLLAAESGASLEFDCAHGSIPAPLTVGADGRFRLLGRYVREQGGPGQVGGVEDSQPANYAGTLQGNTMTLSIELTRDVLVLGPYLLRFQNPGQVVKCL